jgi:putative SOS response-associated peptidase YedK
MCGRYAVDPRRLDRLVRLLSLPPPDFPAHYDIRPSQTVPVIRDLGNGPEWAMMRWGLIPHWAKEAKTSYSTFNARVETAAQKPAFRDPWVHRRCIVPATGFYEWQTLATGNKQPWYFASEVGQALALAGLWDRWSDGQQTLESCTILVGPPESAVARIHDRSPVLLGDTAVPLWISPLLRRPDIPRVLRLPHENLQGEPVSAVADDGLHPSHS